MAAISSPLQVSSGQVWKSDGSGAGAWGTDATGGHGNGLDCAVGSYARGVDANGNAQGCTATKKIYSFGNDLVHSNNAMVKMAQTGSRVKIKESIIGRAGDYKIKWTGFGDCCWVSYAIYKNNVQVGATHVIDGSWHSHAGTWAIEVTENISGWNVGDRIQIYGNGAYHQGSDKLELYADDPGCDQVACAQ